MRSPAHALSKGVSQRRQRRCVRVCSRVVSADSSDMACIWGRGFRPASPRAGAVAVRVRNKSVHHYIAFQSDFSISQINRLVFQRWREHVASRRRINADGTKDKIMIQDNQPPSDAREAASSEQQAKHPAAASGSPAKSPTPADTANDDGKAGNRPGGPQPLAHPPEVPQAAPTEKRP
jgi:hypothetical protein